jgi:hypothetical protein
VSETTEQAAYGTFTCGACGGTFDKGVSDEEAEAERQALTPDGMLEDETGVTCGDCFRKIMGRVQLEAPELLRHGAGLVPGACYRTPGGLPVHYTGCWCPR